MKLFIISLISIIIIFGINEYFLHIDDLDSSLYYISFFIGLALYCLLFFLLKNKIFLIKNKKIILSICIIITAVLAYTTYTIFIKTTFLYHDGLGEKFRYIKGYELINYNNSTSINKSDEQLFDHFSGGDVLQKTHTWSAKSIYFNERSISIIFILFIIFLSASISLGCVLIYSNINLSKMNKFGSAIYFSYAWKDSNNLDREKIITELYDSLKNDSGHRYNVIRDKENLKYKESISEFMNSIGKGNIVVVAISDKYLKSESCMYELYELYLNSQSDMKELRKKIFPLRIESLKLNDPDVLGLYFNYWKNEEDKWEKLINNHSLRIASEQHEKYKKIKKIATDLGKFLNILADINSSSIDILKENDFKQIKDKINIRMKELTELNANFSTSGS